MDQFKQIADKYQLQIRGAAGEHSESKEGIYDLSNKRRLGLTEYQCLKDMYDGITEIIKIEKSKWSKCFILKLSSVVLFVL